MLVYQLAKSPVVRQRPAVEWLNSVLQTASHVLIAYGIGAALFVFWRSLAWWFFPKNLNATTIAPMVIYQVQQNYWKMVPWSLLIVFLVCFGATDLFTGWKGDESINARIGFMIFFTPFITATTLLYGMPQVFERFWIMGASEKRVQTARVMLLLVITQSMFLNVIALVCVSAIAMSTSLGCTPTIIVGTLVIGFGAILFWVLAKWHPFWLEHVSLAVCLIIGGVGSATVVAISSTDGVLHRVAELSSVMGPVPTVLAAIMVTTGSWGLAVWDAARSMGESTRLMECENGLEVVMSNSSIV